MMICLIIAESMWRQLPFHHAHPQPRPKPFGLRLAVLLLGVLQVEQGLLELQDIGSAASIQILRGL